MKVCGFVHASCLERAARAGVDAAGLMLDPVSRQVSLARARELSAAARALGMTSVAVPGPVDAAEAVALCESGDFDAVQVVVTPESRDELARQALPRARAVGVSLMPVFFDGDDVEQRLAAWLAASSAEPAAGAPQSVGGAAGLLDGVVNLDGPAGGGRGVAADWGRAAKLARDVPLLLAGGLTPGNVAAAVAEVAPFGVDVCSGVEREHGVKDEARMRDFVAAARSVR